MMKPSGLLLLAVAFAGGAAAQAPVRVLDGFDDPSPWRVVTSDQVSGTLRQVDGVAGKALCLDYDFQGVSGYVGMQRDLPIAYPGNYAFRFRLRGDSPANDLQFKLVDASGDNVWWVNRPRYAFPQAWTEVRYRQRHIAKAWGPSPDHVLRNSARLEFTVYNNAGGKGSVCLDELTFQALPVDDGAPLAASASTAARPGDGIEHAVDGNVRTVFRSPRRKAAPVPVVLDLGRVREFGGLTLDWAGAAHASRYTVALSDDARAWRQVREVAQGNGGRDWLALPESEARYVRLLLEDGPGDAFALAEATLQPLDFAAIPNDFVRSVAKASPKGWFPRGFSGEQPYWTIVGIDGGQEQGLMGEDGAIEVAKGGFSIEPFVVADGRLATWADVAASQSLQDGYLPIPSVDWTHPAFALRVTAFAQGTRADAQLVARYRLHNTSAAARDYTLALAVRPLQVNPPSQFLNTIGGYSPIHALSFDDDGVASVNGTPRVFARQRPGAVYAVPFDAGMEVGHLLEATPPTASRADDAQGLASGAMLYAMRLQPGESREVDLLLPLSGDAPARGDFDAQALQEAVAAGWREQLGRVKLRVPPAGQPLVDTLRTATAHMLVSRIGPRLQPGTRSYARSWIRDGAMISEGLLRMGHPGVVRDYVDFYAPFQFDDGKVPCCVDDRGSDPVPENDSHGELVFNIAELYRYTGDTAMLARMWPHVAGAYRYMEQLRLSERTEANRARNPAFFGMMPASISHEGYSAKPMHSYWDNFWALRGYKDAVAIAQWLGKDADATRMAASRDQFRADLDASLRAAVRLHGIDYLPGSAELGDFDATSTTIALAPGGEQGRLPATLLANTFERYWREFEERREGRRAWKDYTPYEWRNVAAFVRLGWRERAWRAVEYFFDDCAPRAWNQWGEVVSRTPRQPFFLGDLPHAWVGSDFVRSALDMFAYERELDASIVLAAGVPAAWLEGEGIAVEGLGTAYGPLAYRLASSGGALRLEVPAGSALPAGGLVLPWPYAGRPGAATINGVAAAWSGGELRIDALPATVVVDLPEGLPPPAAADLTMRGR